MPPRKCLTPCLHGRTLMWRPDLAHVLVVECALSGVHSDRVRARAWEGHFGLYGGDGAVVVDGLGDGGGGLLGGEGRLTSSGRAQHSPRLVRLKQNVLLPVGVRRAAAEGCGACVATEMADCAPRKEAGSDEAGTPRRVYVDSCACIGTRRCNVA
eukprot:1119576-Pleurochrysis_carterae.AAC.5